MSTEKVTVARWDTNPAKTSIKDLRKELKLLKDEMVNLEEGSDAFLEIANKAGEIKHQIDEVSESVKGASADFGDMVGNATNVAAGLTGAFQAVAGGLQALGIESKALDETIARMQGLMAVTDGLSKIDNGIKSFNKLTKAINGTTKAGKALKTVLQPKSLLLISTIITGIVLAFKNWEGAIRNALPFVDKICNAFGRVHPDIEKATEAQEKFNAKVREQYEIQKTEQERIASEAERIRKNRLYESLNDEAKKEYNKLQEDIILAQDNYNKLFKKRPEVELSGDEFALRVLDAQLTAYKKTIKKAEDKLKELENNPIFKKKDTPNNTPETPTDDDEAIRKKNEELDIELEKLKRNGKTEEENKEEIIRIETERLDLLKEGTLAYEKQQTLIYNLKKPIEEAKEEQKELTEEQKVWFKTYEEYSQLAFTQEEFFANQRSNLQRLLDDGLINLEQFKIAMNNLNKDVALWEKEQVVELVNNISNVVQASSGAISGFLNGLAEQQDISNEKGFEKQKKLQIAAATIQMLTGITTALSGAFTTKTGIWDWVLAGIQAASIAASGGLQINKIKNTKYDGGASVGSTPSVSSSAISASIIPPVQYSQMVQGANIEGKIGNSRVYVTEMDLVDTIDRVTVQETENRY